jgi:hypothetical protein
MIKEISKIKYDGRCVKIDYSIKNSDPNVQNKDDIKVALSSCDKPLPEFIEVFHGLRQYVEQICNLADGYCDKAEVRGVSLSHSHNIVGAVITVLVKVKTANSPVVINTPHLPSAPYNENGEEPLLPRDCVIDINTLIEEAEKYIDGLRDIPTQEEMFGNESEAVA